MAASAPSLKSRGRNRIFFVTYKWRCEQVLVSVAEHHSNLVPWQLACQRTGATLRHVPLTPDTQELDLQACPARLHVLHLY